MLPDDGAHSIRGFKGQILIVYLMNPSEAFSGGIAIYNPTLEERYGRYFLVGDVPTSDGDWSSGLHVGVGLDQIAHFLEFRDLDQFLERTDSGVLGKEPKSFQ